MGLSLVYSSNISLSGLGLLLAPNFVSATVIAVMPSMHHDTILLLSLDKLPFLLESGVTIHISNQHSDFTSLKTANDRAVCGIGSAVVKATGKGKIVIPVSSGSDLVLQDALFILQSVVHLISIARLTQDSNCSVIFTSDSVEFWSCYRSLSFYVYGR